MHDASPETIRDLEHRIDQLKLLHRLHKLDNRHAKYAIKELEIELKIKISKLPRYERSLYRVKKEFGKDF
jgi:hypothetical protein